MLCCMSCTHLREEHSLVAEAIPVIPGMALLLPRKKLILCTKKGEKVWKGGKWLNSGHVQKEWLCTFHDFSSIQSGRGAQAQSRHIDCAKWCRMSFWRWKVWVTRSRWVFHEISWRFWIVDLWICASLIFRFFCVQGGDSSFCRALRSSTCWLFEMKTALKEPFRCSKVGRRVQREHIVTLWHWKSSFLNVPHQSYSMSFHLRRTSRLPAE